MIAAIERKDLAAACAFMADDVEYDNVPMAKVFGVEAVTTALAPFIGGCTRLEWVVNHQAASGEVVMNERVDRFEMGGRWVELAVAGLFIVRDGKIIKIINASTGGGYSYATGTGGTSIAITPPGVYSTYYEVNKWDVGPLGGLYRPKYFNRGIAVHGSYSVPPYPASHGCVRVSLAAMDWIWLNNMMPRGTKVVVYK